MRALPHFNLDIESQQQRVPEAVVAWRDALNDCDAVLIASPEHGHSLPGVLKNGIDANVVWEEAMVRDADQEKRIHELLASLVAGAKRSAG